MGNRVYRNGGYTVSVAPDGAIYVNENDSLSKYSMAMHGNFKHIDKFGRKASLSSPVIQIPPQKRDLIFTGETIYYMGPLPPGGIELNPIPDPEPDPVQDYVPTQEEIRAHIEMLDSRHGLSRELKQKYYRWASNGKLMTQVAGIGAFFIGGGVGAASGVFGALITPIMAVAALAKIRQAPERFYGLRGIPYALTAWAYHDPYPGFPSGMEQHYRNSHLTGENLETRISGAKSAFRESVSTIRNNINRPDGADSVKDDLRSFYLSIGDRETLAIFLLEELAKEMKLGTTGQSGVYRDLLLSPTPDYRNREPYV